MKIIVEFEFKNPLNERISNEFIFGQVLNSIPLKGVSLKVLNRISDDELTFDSLESKVCEFIRISPGVLQLKSRKKEIVWGRQILHYIAKNKNMGSLSEIGFRFGNKDHATVLHSNRTVEALLETDKVFIKEYKSFIESFK